MSMLNFYINRAGHNLPASASKVLEDAKDELRKVFGREDATEAERQPTRAATSCDDSRRRLWHMAP